MALGDPDTWEIADYLLVGTGLAVVMLVGGYFLGLLWQRLRDRRKTF